MSTAEEVAYDVQGFLGLQSGIAHGWCHSPQLPGRALRVEILAEGAVVAAGVAARLQLELVRPGISEGYHGFSLPLPQAALEGVMLEARESATGQVFARRLPPRATDVPLWQHDITLLGRGLAAMHGMLGRQRPAHAGLTGALRMAARPYAPDVTQAAGIALRRVAQPDTSLILDLPGSLPRGLSDAAAGAWARDAVASIAPLLVQARAELIVIDDGRAAPVLTRIAGLTYCRAEEGEAETRLRKAEVLAAGARILPLPAKLPSIAALRALLKSTPIS